MKLEYFYDKTKYDPLEALYGKRLRITDKDGDIVEAELSGFDPEDGDPDEDPDDYFPECWFLKNINYIKVGNMHWKGICTPDIADITIIE